MLRWRFGDAGVIFLDDDPSYYRTKRVQRVHLNELDPAELIRQQLYKKVGAGFMKNIGFFFY